MTPEMIDSEILDIEGCKINLAHLNKVFFPESLITKGDIIKYYQKVAPQSLFYYENRPLTVTRAPDGIQGQIFTQKQIPTFYPDWIDRCELAKKDGKITHILLNKEATFVYLANQGCITFHLGLSKVDKINYPDRLIFDLDPSSDASSLDSIALLKFVAIKVRELAHSLNLESFIQTTGSRGFHIYIPLDQTSSFEDVHNFAKKFATYLSKTYPEKITIEQRIADRGNKIFIDYARNSYGLNSVAPYTIRTKENAPIATPLWWEELEDKSINSQSFNIKNIFTRLKVVKNPWVAIKTQSYSLKNRKYARLNFF